MYVTFARYVVAIFLLVSLSLAGHEPVLAQNDLPAAEAEPQSPKPAAPLLNEPDDSADVDLGYRPLMQGPVHEAFASPIDPDPTDGVRVFEKAPPESVDEQPPEARPEDEEMKWIPGYWSWSDDQKDYVWVSGLWRKLPPGRTWNPGHWNETSSGLYRWTPGYWIRENDSADTAEYLPMPPKSIDNGPSVPPPGEDYFWVPGCWEYAGSDYRWRSGFWTEQHSGWVWQPACYLYAPQGYVLVDGYWDYSPPERAELYAPVTFYDPVYLQPSYVYRPRYPLVGAALLLNLFVRSGYPNYYYGNYFGPSYLSLGYRPWYDVPVGFGYRSPWFGYYDWKYRKSGIDFGRSMQNYKQNLHSDHGEFKTHRANTTRSLGGNASSISSSAHSNKHFAGSLDDVVKRHGIASVNRNDYGAKGYSANRAATSSGFSRSSGAFRASDSSAGGASRSGFRSGDGVNSLPSSKTRLPSSSIRLPSSDSRLPSSSIQLPSSNGRVPQSIGRSSIPALRSSAFPRSNSGSSSQFSRSLGSGSPSSFSPRSSGSSIQRSSSPSLGRGRGSSGFSGRSSSGGSFNRGNSGGSSNRGKSGGGSKSMGSRGRGKGK